MAEFYAEDLLQESRRLFDRITAWGARRGDVTLIGGWAVHELVDPKVAQQSRDVDLVMHTPKALEEFDAVLNELGLQWRASGRNTFNDCHLIGDAHKAIVVDVFKASDFQDNIFHGMKARQGLLVKPWAERTFVPSLEALLRDKVETIPHRQRDAAAKRLKDLLDVHALAFHNRAGIFPDVLAREIDQPVRRAARAHIAQALALDDRFAAQLDEIDRWLAT